MNTEQIIPVINMTALQEKANEFAMKGAVEALKEHFTGYKSPYMDMLTKDLEAKGVSYSFELPDIIAHLNKSLSAEIDTIVNTAIAQTYLPKVKRFLTRIDSEIRFSDILKQIVAETSLGYDDHKDISIKKDPTYGWLNIEMEIKEAEYRFTLHRHDESKNTYKLLSLPYGYDSKRAGMKIRLEDGASVEMPFTPDVLQDDVIAICARLLMCGSIITMDTDFFSDDMFERDCYCH